MSKVMRVLFFCVGFSLSFIKVAQGQLLVGPVLGGSVNKVTFFDNLQKHKSSFTPGFDGGLMAQMRVRTNFVLNVQLLYSYKSRVIKGTNSSNSDPLFKLKANMTYIELPIFYVLEFKNFTKDFTGQGGKRKAYNWFIGGGPVISYWRSSRGTLRSSYLLENEIEKQKYKAVFNGGPKESFNAETDAGIENINDPNRFQFSINISGGLAFEPVGFHKIVTTMHINIGQTFFSKKSDGYFPASFVDVDDLKSKNHSIRFSVAYLIDTKIENIKKGKSTSGKNSGGNKGKSITRKRKR